MLCSVLSSPSKCYRFKSQFAPWWCDFVHDVWFFLFWFLSVRPSPPKCWVEGSEEKGGTVSLRCKSSQGSSPLKYAWTKESGNLPPTATQSEFPPVNAGLVQHYSANTSSESLIFGNAWITCSFRPVCCQAKYSCCRWKQKHFLSLIATKHSKVFLCAICCKQRCRAFRNGCTFWMALLFEDPQTGELLIRNHSDSYTGRYLCEVSNEVGTERCTYALQAYNRKYGWVRNVSAHLSFTKRLNVSASDNNMSNRVSCLWQKDISQKDEVSKR